MCVEERHHVRQGVDEVPRELGVGRMPDNDEERHLVLHDAGKLVGFVANPRVVGERDPAACGHRTQPRVIFAVVSKVITVSLYREARIAQDAGKLRAKIAVSEEN
ncbi:MAG: hypothetical protein A3G76_14210 [Acidobacteria bacterium RIFCSPLOWO2_12_FULL_65_11]|nr:MAG: hypothetical protein A3G76_14210 [Acidobacteria bacterium RIFCSPLOWO2_12_FULL_65_11]